MTLLERKDSHILVINSVPETGEVWIHNNPAKSRDPDFVCSSPTGTLRIGKDIRVSWNKDEIRVLIPKEQKG